MVQHHPLIPRIGKSASAFESHYWFPPQSIPHTSSVTVAGHVTYERRDFMKAVVFHDIGDIRLDDVPEAQIKDSTDAIVL
jgi:hypothetical protein